MLKLQVQCSNKVQGTWHATVIRASYSHQDKLQLSATQSKLHHQGNVLSCTTQGQMQSSVAQPILHHQEETKRVVTTRLTRGIIEDLIESIPYYDQIINSMV